MLQQTIGYVQDQLSATKTERDIASDKATRFKNEAESLGKMIKKLEKENLKIEELNNGMGQA